MNQQVTLEVSENVWRRANILAAQKQQRLEDVLEEWLEETVAETRVEDLSDEEVLSLTELTLTEEQQETLSRLLKLNREGLLSFDEQLKLDELMQVYERGLLRKSQALRVAVQRGLIPPLTP